LFAKAQIELRHLRYAVAAARFRSFRRAAEALRVKQSILSRRILQLEDRLGVVLFERSSRGVDFKTMRYDGVGSSDTQMSYVSQEKGRQYDRAD